MSYTLLDFLKKTEGINPLIGVHPVDINIAKSLGYYQEPTSELSNIYDKVFLSRPLTYAETQIMDTYEKVKYGYPFTLSNIGKPMPVKYGEVKSKIKRVGLIRKRKN